MKTKNHSKKNNLVNVDKFDRKSSKVKPVMKQKDSKRRLSIYDEFDEEDLDNFGYDDDDSFDD